MDTQANPARTAEQPVAQAVSPKPDQRTTPQRLTPELARGVVTRPAAVTTPGAVSAGGTPVPGGYLANPGGGTGGRDTPVVGRLPGVGGVANPSTQPTRGGVPMTGGSRAAAAPNTGLPVNSGRAKDEEDTEHRNKYVTDADPKSLFGTDEPWVEPVIGDSR
jgi:hypothetical protein